MAPPGRPSISSLPRPSSASGDVAAPASIERRGSTDSYSGSRKEKKKKHHKDRDKDKDKEKDKSKKKVSVCWSS